MKKKDIEITNTGLKEKCLRYFRGKSTYEDEIFINQCLSDGRLSMDEFRNMEKDWSESEIPTNEQRMAFMKISGKVKSRRWKRLMLKLAVPAAAAVVLIAVLSIHLFMGREEAVTTYSTAYLETEYIVLPDSSKVWLNSATTLTYGSDFNKRDREVTLSGEAFFDVAKNPSKPFIVRMKDAEITVKGTLFNVTAYDGENGIQAALMTGQIQFRTGKDYIYLSPGEVISYNRDDRSMSKSRKDVNQYCSWLEGKLDCESITLDMLFSRLTSLYGTEINYVPVKYKDKAIRVMLDTRESMDDVLGALSVIVPISWTWQDDGSITITEI
ncbi:MAG TPA: hypothetical protein DCY24_08460 [Rikenellaceae bacterium]|nr:hypothetical protein [Rikenellaceae bacterium]